MKSQEVKVGKTYQAKITGRVTEVRITGVNRHGGWDAVNVMTNRKVRIKSAQKLRAEAAHGQTRRRRADAAEVSASPGDMTTSEAAPAEPEANTAPTGAPEAPEATTEAPETPKRRQRADGRMSGLDAAAKVLEETGTPMTTREMCDAMHAKGYWSSNAPTPHNTLYSAILREIQKKGDAARFVKAARGKFTLKS